MGTVCASEYGGPHDPTSGTHGYHGDNLTGRMAYAELRMGTALGGLPYRHKLQITYGGRSVVAEKLDIGLGGAGCGGHDRAIDLWWETARALGFNGLAPVDVAGAGSSPTTGVAKNAVLGIPGTPEIPGEQLLLPGGVNPGEALSRVKEAFGFFGILFKILKLLTSREGWLRIGKVLVGLFLLLIGVLGLANIKAAGEPIKATTRAATKGAEVAALVK